MFIQTEHTPNPSTLKFVPGKVVMKKGTANFQNKETATNSPLAKKIFEIEGVKSIFFGSDFITITKIDTTEWEVIKPMILGSIADYFKSNNPIFDTNENLDDTKQEEIPANQDNKIVKQIKELIETRVRPAVAMDGGDIVFEKFDEGIVYLHMQGSCSGCPSSTATLKNGIENMLKHYIPEVIEVRPIND
ncbi:MAG: Fe/S biogenesis protein NfuA [Alphaproteobacteria bacterium MarineAlpha5_Bin11]|nr:NifU family protein [Pelagibacteraceae bacterium]PPR43199.1 MAG: Fe/S biogenesis protein NfuA [Alphaproteobacteria bacterium MarineAlpha5_Bin11]PPR52110.1 MAG: Fe/S biogenesis protein NfuA [Alphaproteobacteria bacterium MarineAlpha5_Bin10]|tara:strand:+ start:3179 stop:3748 length:570 start_codon:yes stop_codon:yes gene_type:complete